MHATNGIPHHLIVDGYNSATTGIQAVGTGWWLLWITEVITVIHLIASILLLLGISQQKAQLIKTYVYVNIAVLAYDVILVIVLFAMMGTYDDGSLTGVLLYMAVAYLISFLLMIYYTVVVRSYAVSIEENTQTPGVGMA